jgi:hypothetical protein
MKALCAAFSSLRDWPYPMCWRAVAPYGGRPGRRKVEEACDDSHPGSAGRDGEAVGVDDPLTGHGATPGRS